MRVLKSIIIDDERPARKELSFLLKDLPGVEVIGEADCIQKAIELIKKLKPDLIFLDIQLAGENGFDLLEKVCVDFKIVFVTAFDMHAIKAFDVNASDYLLKPVDPERLEKTIKRIQGNSVDSKSIQKKFNDQDSVYLKQNNCIARFVEIQTIIAITSVGNHSRILTLGGNRYIILKTLKQWENELPDSFIRVNRSTIVNKTQIIKIDNYSRGHHKVSINQIDDPLEVSRSCFRDLRKAYN